MGNSATNWPHCYGCSFTPQHPGVKLIMEHLPRIEVDVEDLQYLFSWCFDQPHHWPWNDGLGASRWFLGENWRPKCLDASTAPEKHKIHWCNINAMLNYICWKMILKTLVLQLNPSIVCRYLRSMAHLKYVHTQMRQHSMVPTLSNCNAALNTPHSWWYCVVAVLVLRVCACGTGPWRGRQETWSASPNIMRLLCTHVTYLEPFRT